MDLYSCIEGVVVVDRSVTMGRRAGMVRVATAAVVLYT